MPDTELAAPPSPSSTPAPTGIDSLMMDAISGIEETPDAPATTPDPTPEPKDTKTPPATTPKVEAKLADKPEAKSDKPSTVPIPKKEENNQLRRRVEQLSADEKKWKSDMAKLQEENKTLAAKRFVTPEMEKEIDDNKKEISRLKSQIAESAFERSEEFKSRFVEPWNRVRDNALQMVEQMAVKLEDDSTRKATPADFWRVFNSPVGEQAEEAQRLFGTNALRVLSQIDRMNDLRREADVALDQHRQGLEARTKQTETQQREQFQAFQKLRTDARKELSDKYPQYFAPDEANPEASDALAKGFEFVDRAANLGSDMAADERAAYAEVVRARAGWFPRGVYEITALRNQVKSLETELAKYRGADPGQEKEKPTPGAPKEELPGSGVGIEGLADQIERDMNS